MPVVPLVAAPLSGIAVLRQHEILTGTEVLRRQCMLDEPLVFQADRAWVQDHAGRRVYDTGTDLVRVDYLDLRRGQQSAVLRLPKQSSPVYDLWGAAISEKAGRA